MMRQVAPNCHTIRNTASTASCPTATWVLRFRKARRNCACRSEATPRVRKPLDAALLNFQILPDTLAVATELRCVTRADRCSLGAVRKHDIIDVLHLTRAFAENNHSVTHRH